MRPNVHRLLIVTILLCMAMVPSTLAQTAAGARADDTVANDGPIGDAAWPEVAANQERAPRTGPITNGPPADIRCLNPCVGGSGCTGWESVENAYCRNIGGVTYDCASSGGSQWCMRKQLESGLWSCMTCIN